MKLPRNIKVFINYVLGPLLFAWLSWSIYREVRAQPDLPKAWEEIRRAVGLHAAFVPALLLLMLLNWGLEAWKWRLVVAPVQQVDFFTAFRAVLSGLSFSVTMPNRMGEYLGRVLYMREGNRLRTVSLTIVASISQVIVTLAMGWIALVVLLQRPGMDRIIVFPWNRVVAWGTLLVLIVTLTFYFRLARVVKWLRRIPLVQRFSYLIDVLSQFRASLLLRLLALSLFRFLVFILQYYLAFRLFGVDLSWGETLLAASVNFLVMAIIPSVAIADVGLRTELGLRIFGLYSANALGITLASVSIWFVNLILPAIVGSLLLLGIRKFWKTPKAPPA